MQFPDPTATAAAPFAPAARRPLAVFGAPVELVWLPERLQRQGRPGTVRPPFAPSIAERILAAETIWRGDGLRVTPNRFPFAECQLLLWRDQPSREHDLLLLRGLFTWVDQLGGAGLLNSIGAAASIARAHAHVTPERRPFLAGLPERPLADASLPDVAGVHYVHKQLPCTLLGVRGEAGPRAEAVHALQLRRLTASWNVITQDRTAWLYPRSAQETPAPQFPYALGAAEVWGRWCFLGRDEFERATGPELEQALLTAGVPAEA